MVAKMDVSSGTGLLGAYYYVKRYATFESMLFGDKIGPFLAKIRVTDSTSLSISFSEHFLLFFENYMRPCSKNAEFDINFSNILLL